MDDQLTALTAIFTGVYYWVAAGLMFFIHAGFCLYEVAASRRKNIMHTLMKNTMTLPVVSVPIFIYGWSIYNGWSNGPGFTGGIGQNFESALPWKPWTGGSLNSNSDNYQSPVHAMTWVVFLLYAWTAASIVSSALIERIRLGAFWVLAVVAGSIGWVTGAAWGWHPDGWMVQLLGYHDSYASGVIHALAGGFALGVLCVLGPRIGKFSRDGAVRTITPHNPWLVTVGLFAIYTGFWGLYMASHIPVFDLAEFAGMEGAFWSTTNIYLTPTTISAVTMNFLMSLSGGLLMGFLVSRGCPFWTYSSGLGGLVAASAGNDLYHPLQALFVAMVSVPVFYWLHHYVERRFRIDDAVGAIAVHGYAGLIGLVISGFMLRGYPASLFYPSIITPWGQITGAAIMFVVMGFMPAYVVSRLLNRAGLLRVPERIEIAGLDYSETLTRSIEAARFDATEEQAARDRDLV